LGLPEFGIRRKYMPDWAIRERIKRANFTIELATMSMDGGWYRSVKDFPNGNSRHVSFRLSILIIPSERKKKPRIFHLFIGFLQIPCEIPVWQFKLYLYVHILKHG
jgi:hypothetical protein